MYKKNLNNCSLLLEILKSPLPTSPIILDFSYMNKSKSKPQHNEFYLYPSNVTNHGIHYETERQMSLPVKRKLDSIRESDETQIQNYQMEKRRLINVNNNQNEENLLSSSSSSISVNSNSNQMPSYTTMTTLTPANNFDFMHFCFENPYSIIQPASEFDNFYYPTNHIENSFYD
ncbi:unnamed protein product [Brachionus calyciflorus]|uniref:Uncharacterized protein n=1 Tax=Brachionus calyciflorus TaxID=104777 RepID=A0A813N4P7_9BILA|nr:unnamed protein product [Brachionus calyciflorus]